jgi:hypothetical protein
MTNVIQITCVSIEVLIPAECKINTNVCEETTGSVFSRRDESRVIFRNVGTVHVLHVARRSIKDFSYLNSGKCESLV